MTFKPYTLSEQTLLRKLFFVFCARDFNLLLLSSEKMGAKYTCCYDAGQFSFNRFQCPSHVFEAVNGNYIEI